MTLFSRCRPFFRHKFVLAVDAGPGALAHARAAVGLALGDQGIGADPAQCLSVECAEPDCGGGGREIGRASCRERV